MLVVLPPEIAKLNLTSFAFNRVLNVSEIMLVIFVVFSFFNFFSSLRLIACPYVPVHVCIFIVFV